MRPRCAPASAEPAGGPQKPGSSRTPIPLSVAARRADQSVSAGKAGRVFLRELSLAPCGKGAGLPVTVGTRWSLQTCSHAGCSLKGPLKAKCTSSLLEDRAQLGELPGGKPSTVSPPFESRFLPRGCPLSTSVALPPRRPLPG